MEDVRRNLWVGIFVLFGLAALGVLVVLFGRGPTMFMQRGTYALHVKFDQVSDIREGNLVIAKGITIGRVISVDLVDPQNFDAGVDVVVAIESRYRIPKDSRAQTTEPVLGQGRPPIEIIPGRASEAAVAGSTLDGQIQRAIDSIFPPGVVSTLETSARQIGDAAGALTPVLEELEDILQARTPQEVDRGLAQGNMSSAIARFDSTLRHFNEVLGDGQVKSQLRETVANVHKMSEQGRDVMAKVDTAASDFRDLIGDGRRLVANTSETISRIDERTQQLTVAATTSFDRVDQVLDHLAFLGQRVRSGEGNIGRLFMDDKLYESLATTAERLALAVEEFRALIAEWREGKIRVAL